MKTNKKSVQLAGLAIIVAALANWFSPLAGADEVSPRNPVSKKPLGCSVTLKATSDKHLQQKEYRRQQQNRGANSTEVVHWKEILKDNLNGNNQDVKLLAEQAIILSLSMVVITYNAPPPTQTQPQTVISAASQTWQWKAWCWSSPTQPSLPPPQGGTVNNVPEPASLVSGLIGVSIAGLSLWCRKRRQYRKK